jgi:hypothetical protein
MGKNIVGILTTFYSFDRSYSLCSVVESQIVSLLKNGYRVVLFVLENFKDDKVPEGVEIRKIVPQFPGLVDYSGCQEVLPNIEEQANRVYGALKENTKDIDVMLEHDLIFQGWFLPYCMGIHKLANESQIKWFHWIHSVPSPMPNECKYPHTLRFTLPKNSKLVYLNNYNVIRVAEAYHTFPANVRVVHNPVDPRLFHNLHPLTRSLIDKYDLLSADFIQTYPLSTPRMMSGKQLGVLFEVFGKLKVAGNKVRIIVCNAHANDKREKQNIAEAISKAQEHGLNQTEIIFTSLEDAPIYELGVPKEVVSQLFQLSNLFIFPSISENCSLILLESMLSGNLLVLNESVPSMREFGQDNAIYLKFGSQDENVKYDDRAKWMEDVSKLILSEFAHNKNLKSSRSARQKFNMDYIFRTQLEPLLWEK